MAKPTARCADRGCALLFRRGAAAHENPTDGYLSTASPSGMSARVEAFRQGFHEVGYVERKNIVIEWRCAEGKVDRLPALAAAMQCYDVSETYR